MKSSFAKTCRPPPLFALLKVDKCVQKKLEVFSDSSAAQNSLSSPFLCLLLESKSARRYCANSLCNFCSFAGVSSLALFAHFRPHSMRVLVLFSLAPKTLIHICLNTRIFLFSKHFSFVLQ